MNDGTTPTALVVGGSGVIGQALCRHFAQQRWRVGVHFRTHKDPARAMVRSIVQGHGRADSFQADVSNQESVDAMTKQLMNTWTRLDALVYAAGTNVDCMTLRLRPDEWASIIHSNLTGAFHCLQSLGRVFHDQGYGAIVIIGSLSSIRGGSGQTAYAASKAGLLGLVKSIAKEWGPSNIRINAVFPGWQHSPLSENTLKNHDYSDQVLGRSPRLSEVADLVFHLAASHDISGQIFNLDNRIL